MFFYFKLCFDGVVFVLLSLLDAFFLNKCIWGKHCSSSVTGVYVYV